jgi:hypothetical protein
MIEKRGEQQIKQANGQRCPQCNPKEPAKGVLSFDTDSNSFDHKIGHGCQNAESWESRERTADGGGRRADGEAEN